MRNKFIVPRGVKPSPDVIDGVNEFLKAFDSYEIKKVQGWFCASMKKAGRIISSATLAPVPLLRIAISKLA
jgi:hypothetical protein